MNKLFLFILSFLLSTYGWSANRYSVATGNLSSTSTWSATSGGAPGASVPTTGDNAYIETYTVTCDTAWSCDLVTLTSGTLDTNDQTCTWGRFISSSTNARTLDLGASTVNITGSNATVFDLGAGTNLTLTAGTSTINVQPTTPANLLFFAGNKTFYNLIFQGNTGFYSGLGYNLTCNDFTYIGGVSKLGSLRFSPSTTTTVNGTFTLTGNSATNRPLIYSLLGSPATITVSTVSIDNVDFRDISSTNAIDLSAGSVGDCGGNTNITFTASADQHWTSATGGNWSDVSKWTSRVPLPQDDVYFDNAFDASQTVTADMPRLGKTIDWTGATGSPTFSLTSTTNTIYGGLTLISGMTVTQSQAFTFESGDRVGTKYVTLNGKTLGNTVDFYVFGSAIEFLDAFSCSTFRFWNGTLKTNGYSVFCTKFQSFTTNTRALDITGSQITCSSLSGADVVLMQASGMTLTSTGSKFIFSDTGALSKTFAGAGLTYGDFEAAGGGTGAIIFTDSDTFNNITVNAPKKLLLHPGITQTVNSFTAVGTAGNTITIQTTITGYPAKLSDASGLNMLKYCTIKDITATGGATWLSLLAMGNVDVSGNTGWIWNAGLGIIMIND